MTITQHGIVLLIKSAITGEKYKLPKEFSIEAEDVQKLIKKHHLMLLAYVGAVNCGISKTLPYMRQLFLYYCKEIVRNEEQMAAVQKVFDAFEENGIDYLPTKGCNLKAVYPKPEMRKMGDADISIRKEQSEEIIELMPKIGFTQADPEDGVLVWNSPSLHLELHMHMKSFYNQSYYDDVWERVHAVSKHRYAFGVEDEFVHVFNHFAKHYRSGGIGCRQLVDLYVLRRKHPQMNERYIYREMKKIYLHKFYKNVMALIDVWFEDGAATPITDQIGDFIFESGNWGTMKSFVASKQVTLANESGEKGNFREKAILSTVTPNLEYMQQRYPVLYKVPFLLPLFWIVRWFKAISVQKEHIPEFVKSWSDIENKRVLDLQERFKMVGLDIK